MAKTWSKIAVLFVALGLGVLAAEAWARRIAARQAPRPEIQGDVFRRSDDTALGVEHVPRASMRAIYRLAADAESLIVEHEINDLGWRGPEYVLPKPPGVVRIACVGDSHTFGFGVPNAHTWPACLQRMLPVWSDGRTVEACNFGIGGLGTEQEVRLLATRVLECEPDVVVLQTYMNDAERSYEVSSSTLAYPGLAPPIDTRNHGLWAFVRARSCLVDLAIRARIQSQLSRYYVASRAMRYAHGHAERERLQRALRYARWMCLERGIPLVVVYYPLLIPDGRRLMAHQIGDAWSELCAAERIPFLDLEPSFLGRDLERLRVHPLDYHVTGEAHDIAALAIANFLREGDWARPPGP